METLTKMNETLERAEQVLSRLEERDDVCTLHMENTRLQIANMYSWIKGFKWIAGLIFVPMMGLLIQNQIALTNMASAEEIDEKYLRREQAVDAFNYAASDLSFSIKELSDSVKINTHGRPFIWNMETIKAILNSRR